jgi:SOS-response transcriptional repressor LexA
MSLSKNLKKLLFEREITPTDLAKALDMPVPTIHRIVTGKTTRPHEKSIKAISDYFSIDPNKLAAIESSSLAKNKITEIPLIQWNDLDANTEVYYSENKVAAAGVSDKAFAMVMPDHSMNPIIEKGSTLIFDPTATPTDRCLVLVKIDELNIFIVRQLLIDLDNSYIKSLNNDFGTKSLRLLSKKDLIIARLVEVRITL